MKKTTLKQTTTETKREGRFKQHPDRRTSENPFERDGQEPKNSLLGIVQEIDVESAAAEAQALDDIYEEAKNTHQLFNLTDLSRVRSMKLEHDHLSACIKQISPSASMRRLVRAEKHQVDAVVKLTEKYKNFSSFLLDYLAPQINLQAAMGEPLRLPNFCLVGPPGIGKTAMLSELAEVLGIGSAVFDASSLQAAHVLNGLTRNFATADFGLIFKTMMLEKSHQTGELRPANALICVDEVEKVGKSDHYGSILDLMLTLLEQRTAGRFTDAAIPELPLDLSALNWCFTSNSVDALSAPLRSRLMAIDVPPPTHEQSIDIAASIFAERMERIQGRIPNPPDLLFDDLERLAAFPPRQQKQLIEHGIARAVWEQRDTVVIEGNFASLAQRKIGFV